MASAAQIDRSRFLQVLVVGERGGEQGALGIRLTQAGFQVSVAEDTLESVERVVRESPDLVVANNDEASRMDGIEWVRRLREVSDVPVVLVSAQGSIPECEEAMCAGANRFLQRRCDLDRIGAVARELTLERPAEGRIHRTPRMTATQARVMRDRELFDLLERLLFETRGNIAEMARRLGKDRSTVRYHLKRFGMLSDQIRRDCAPRVERVNGVRPINPV